MTVPVQSAFLRSDVTPGTRLGAALAGLGGIVGAVLSVYVGYRRPRLARAVTAEEWRDDPDAAARKAKTRSLIWAAFSFAVGAALLAAAAFG